jgi:hypothetical protein
MNRDQKLLGRERGGQQQRDDGPTVAAMVPIVVWVSTAARQRPAVAQPHREAECAMTKLGELLDRALASGDDAPVRTELVQHSGLPGARLSLRLLSAFAGAVGEVARRADPPVAALEALLDRWAAMPNARHPSTGPRSSCRAPRWPPTARWARSALTGGTTRSPSLATRPPTAAGASGRSWRWPARLDHIRALLDA